MYYTVEYSQYSCFRLLAMMKITALQTKLGIIILSGAGVTLIGALAFYLRRRRRKPRLYTDIEPVVIQQNAAPTSSRKYRKTVRSPHGNKANTGGELFHSSIILVLFYFMLLHSSELGRHTGSDASLARRRLLTDELSSSQFSLSDDADTVIEVNPGDSKYSAEELCDIGWQISFSL
jgi:hypothetical protein